MLIRIPFFKNYWTVNDIKSTSKVVSRGSQWANGPEIEVFEDKLAKIVTRKYAVTFNSGTSALFGILWALEIHDREVIVPSFTFIATANSVLHAGGKVVFADVEPETYGLDPDDVKRKITPNTIAVMPIHYAGQPCQIDKLKRLTDRNGLLLIEDAAEALGTKLKGRMVGTFGIASVFSFAPNKVISTGEGGAVVTNSKKMYERLKLFRSHGRQEKGDYFTSTDYMDYVALGYGMRMPSICAALGLSQIKNLNKIIRRRRKVAAIYDQYLRNINEIEIPQESDTIYHTYQMYTIRIKSGRAVRDQLQIFLDHRGITSKVYFEPIHKTSYYRQIMRSKINLPITEKLSSQVLSLPFFPQITKAEQTYVIRNIKDFFKCAG